MDKKTLSHILDKYESFLLEKIIKIRGLDKTDRNWCHARFNEWLTLKNEKNDKNDKNDKKNVKNVKTYSRNINNSRIFYCEFIL